MVSLFSVIGLAFDLVGAGMLAWGLFRPAVLLYPGFLRPPETAAEDQAYGVAGFGLLAVGFFLQALSAFGLGSIHNICWGIIGGVAAVVVGAGAAYLLFGLVYIVRFQKENTRAKEAGLPRPPMHRERQGWRFWAFVED